MKKSNAHIYGFTKRYIGPHVWNEVTCNNNNKSPAQFLKKLLQYVKKNHLPEHLSDLARFEYCISVVKADTKRIHLDAHGYEINPTLEIVHSAWKLLSFVKKRPHKNIQPRKGDEWILVWKTSDGRLHTKAASQDELLALKMVLDKIDPEVVARTGNVSLAVIDQMFYRAVTKGLLISARSKLIRDMSLFSHELEISDEKCIADTFTLQWHVTNLCDLHCKHCYDRTKRSPLTLKQGVKILDDMSSFCRNKHVDGHICFSGGNPFLSRHFYDLYKKAEQRDFSVSVLGNPVSSKELEKILKIQRPTYYQTSLEGMQSHNDTVRGIDNFKRVIRFLRVLRKKNVSSAIMLTLTEDNIDQVLPLAEFLRGKTDYFTFNRLSPVGEGSQLKLPSLQQYKQFLKDYIKASEKNPIIGFKDNLINIELYKNGDAVSDGCTGYGCGAAFNFLTVLPDGEVHACRKFPSPVGNILKRRLSLIYDSKRARKYRRGSSACDGCALRHVCGGCLAITSGYGGNIFRERDPYCYI
ncbi:MAG: thio(seleno)oxazole modification radical SAM maturase SbtM [Candidatus Ancaeobacter aquaticus]|nr:thio(seleno)oxazole modification radical SAM maturase SbtM [Candidatus Ancaeobacter aquaticus]